MTRTAYRPIVITGALFLSSTIAVLAQSGRTEAIREILALRYPEGQTISVKFNGTARLPRSSGEAKVERKKGATEIEIELDEMKPASLFGGDYNTYVLWVVSPEGQVDNTGEFLLEGNRSKLNVSTPLETFGMFISAEPHFLVASPSRFVVMENTRPTETVGPLEVSVLEYQGHAGSYQFERESLEDLDESKGETRPHLDAARTAVSLAERAGAEDYAESELERAREALRRAELAAETEVSSQDLMLYAHDVIRAAVDAENLSRERAYQAALEEERRANAQRVTDLKDAMREADTNTEMARLEAKQAELEAEMEAKARQRAQEAAEEALQQAEKARLEQHEAEEEKLEAEREAAEARERLEAVLGQVAEVRDSARGLVVNMPNVLFEFDRAELRPEGREKLAKISGVLAITNGYRLKIEGHTDSVGSDAYNMELSRSRAESVRDYLLQQSISRETLSVEGLGESRPIASNESASGREQNRRVEIVISEDPNSAAMLGGSVTSR
jgi:outer membrane protein OmpA-like peptidoglycan-associated protein